MSALVLSVELFIKLDGQKKLSTEIHDLGL